jgi:hypothetical protein
MYMYYWLKKISVDEQETFEKAMGILWVAEDFNQTGPDIEEDDTPVSRLRIPLAAVINPDLLKLVKKRLSLLSTIGGGDYAPGTKEQVVEMDESFSKEGFLSMIGALNRQRPEIMETPAEQFIGHDPSKKNAQMPSEVKERIKK